MIKVATKKFDPANWPEGIWSDYVPGARLKIRKISSPVLREFRKMYSHSDEKFNDVVTDYMIEDQEGFGDENGNPFPQPLNLDCKNALMNDLLINDWVWAVAKAHEMEIQKKAAEEIKK